MLSLDVEEHSIVAETLQIPHRDLRQLDGIYIVPTKKGKFKADVSIMCSEYLEPIESCIDIEVVWTENNNVLVKLMFEIAFRHDML